MAEQTRLQLTIGPVQTFVAQSRRTRDLWASSYLLSHLAGVAMRAIEDADGRIVLPYRGQHDNEAKEESQSRTRHGRWPNRFVADVEDGKAAAAAAAAKQAIDETWKAIADSVWKKCFGEQASAQTKATWERQIGNFWEISWVISPADSSNLFDPLAQRKNWRTTPVTAEPGDHCTMMGDFQELSGFIRSKERKNQDKFWEQLREKLGGRHLGKDERLCAIALIKRMFPLVAETVIGADLQAANWPSTPYIAAIPWLGKVGASNPDAAKDYATRIRDQVERPLGEKNAEIRSLSSIPNVGDFFQLDGNFFHETALANAKDMPLGLSEADEARVRGELLTKLNELYRTVQSRPSSFYALLLMDGDSMGGLLSEAREKSSESEQAVTRALGQFADQVPKTVCEHDGVTIYCGGDDVLAMLPVPNALRCATALSDLYQQSFNNVCDSGVAKEATISAAVVYCPFRAPLREVLSSAHHLLDDVAKDQTGRDSLAIAVMKSSGLAAQWSAPWKEIRKDNQTILDLLAEHLRGTGDRPSELSSGFLYQIRERFARLTDQPLSKPGSFGHLPEGIDLEVLLRAEYLRVSNLHGQINEQTDSPSEAGNDLLGLLTTVCRRIYRDKDKQTHINELSLGMDGPLVVRFLASEGEETTR
ncbi:type III-B CRISPR-associated protein Cas10/Cmr2 [Thalassoglobus polymorphus]|uniref:CRISPR-associated protein n=1 Tax=Thalassoglobus polymorphus TaxID=2527994 RepID=A0A517QHN5_9PLAN|nr:type III-B CRISPR-associated protein Cas10/Cmr2 [Thalassoglobus polymorphus]QDT31139.1 CRISPR-associated protein [Thalassoglobus polymorphus]